MIFIIPAAKPIYAQESLGTLILANLAFENNVDVQILRFWEIDTKLNDYEIFRSRFVEEIKEKKPDLLCFYSRCDIYHINIDISRRIKNIFPDIKICFGGPQAELTAVETLNAFSWVDFVCCGEGENVICNFIQAISEDEPLNDIQGLIYRDGNGVITCNKLPEYLSDNYSINYKYLHLVPKEVIERSKVITVDVGRGCPFNCSFCSTKTFWKRKFRLRDMNNLMEEINYFVEKYKKKSFTFEHDLFTSNKERIMSFCKKIIDSGTEISWGCSSRADTLDEEMLDYMVRAGMDRIYFGIETGSPRLQKKIHKNLDIERTYQIIVKTITKGVYTTASFIYGFPDENESDIEQTLELIARLISSGISRVQVHLCNIMNGTELYDEQKDNLFLSSNISNIVTSFGYKENLYLIENNSFIFASYYDISNPIRYRMRYLDIFVRCFMKIKMTMRLLGKICEESGINWLGLYDYFCIINENLLKSFYENICFIPSILKDVNKYDFELIDYFIHSFIEKLNVSKFSQREKKGLVDICEFEEMFFYVRQGKYGLKKVTRECQFDFKQLLNRGTLKHICASKCTITMELTNEGSVKIENYMKL